jgi:MurNAc alpha-1-phosphate uridylyltransferase
MVNNPDFHPQGDFGLSNGRIDETVGHRLTYASLGVLSPELFAGCEPGVFELAPLLRRAIREGRVGGERFTGRWHNVGTLAQLQMLNVEASRDQVDDRTEKPA